MTCKNPRRGANIDLARSSPLLDDALAADLIRRIQSYTTFGRNDGGVGVGRPTTITESSELRSESLGSSSMGRD